MEPLLGLLLAYLLVRAVRPVLELLGEALAASLLLLLGVLEELAACARVRVLQGPAALRARLQAPAERPRPRLVSSR
jgi:hypothetical protein